MTILVDVTCEGSSPILFNRKSEEMLYRLWSREKAPKNASRPDVKVECEGKLYKSQTTGLYFIPARMLMAALINAGQYIRLDGKRQVSTAKSTTLPSFLELEDQELPLLYQEQGWSVDWAGGVNPNGGEAVAIVRPRFDKWGFTAHISIDDAEIDEGRMRTLFDYAGSRRGRGAVRPQKKGTFGKFRVMKWERVESRNTLADAAE